MKRVLLALSLSVTATAALADVGVSVQVNQPGFYGEINIGGYPQPQVVYQQPVVAVPVPVGVPMPPPIYLRVQPGHLKHWSHHCAYYNACGRPVYFVQENWYNQVYLPRYYGQPAPYGDDDDDRDHHHGHGHHDHDHHGHGHDH